MTGSKLKVKTVVSVPSHAMRSCQMHGRGPHYAVEAAHQCLARQSLFEALAKMLPMVLRPMDVYDFRTLNNEKNPTTNCLFDGVELELHTEPKIRPEFGFCFSRSALVTERDRYTMSPVTPFDGWVHREPTDADRLRINRRGCEALYFVRAPLATQRVTINELRAEIANSLGIANTQRLTMTSGPFIWDGSFAEDGLDAYDTYFREDLIVDARHMKTSNGSALLYIFES